MAALVHWALGLVYTSLSSRALVPPHGSLSLSLPYVRDLSRNTQEITGLLDLSVHLLYIAPALYRRLPLRIF